MKNILLLGCFSYLALFTGCISSNPTNADRTPLQKLNGDSYESSNSLGIVTELPLLRKLSGGLYCGKDLDLVPAKLAKVELSLNQKLIGETSSDSTGHYVLSAKISKNTKYNLSIKAKCGSHTTIAVWTEDNLKLEDIFLTK
ncbi:MAG: hypothetical protein H7256_05870 [Bdellovibrio sp.]|nr:hypothetical protein [Bdellovibrio sp.]